MPNKIEALRTGLRYLKFAASAQPSDTLSLLIGSTSVVLGQRLANDPVAIKRCDVVKEMQSLAVDAQIELPKGGPVAPQDIPRLVALASRLGSYADGLAKTACQRKD